MSYKLNRQYASTHFPPNGGWRYRQPETQWQAPNPKIDLFEDTAQRILQHRLANPGHGMTATIEAARNDLDAYTAKRIFEEAPSAIKDWLIITDPELKKNYRGTERQSSITSSGGCGSCSGR